MATFIEEAKAGRQTPEQINDWIDRWHAGDGQGQSLAQYLGMSMEQYAEWVQNPASLASLFR